MCSKGSTYTTQKAIALNIFLVAVSEGHGILNACEMAGKCTSFTPPATSQWAQAVYRDFSAETANISIDDITDDRLGIRTFIKQRQASKMDLTDA